MKTIDCKLDADGIALLTIDVPDRSMNVLTPELVADIGQVVTRIAEDDAVKGAVVTSGKESFAAGADLAELVATFDRRKDIGEVYAWCRSLQQSLRGLETCGKPVAAAINGTALGGGLEICLACHYRVVADRADIRLGQPEVSVGLIPGGGATQRLPRLIGIEPALKLLTRGSRLSPVEAVAAGFIDELVPPGREVAAARAWILERGDAVQAWDRPGFKVPGGAGLMHPSAAQTFTVATALAQKTVGRNYPAPIAILSAVYEGTVLPMDRALDIESKYFARMLMHPVARNMARTLFVNKHEADKLVRRPQEPDKRRVRKLGILGAGMMGAGIAYVSAYAGMQVVLLDTDRDKAEKGRDHSRALLGKRVDDGRMTADEADAILDRICATADYALLDGCELIIEAVFEDREVKADVTRRAERTMPPNAIFASNTSTLPISGLAQASQRPERFIGIHFFSPVEKMPLVEVIVGGETADATLAAALDYVQQLRKTPIVVNDSRGFYTSRVFGVYCREGMTMLAEGIHPALIENVARQAGMPVGPLAVTDEVSLELSYHVMQQARKDLGAAYRASPADAVLEQFVVELGRKGRRSGKGFYDYPQGTRKRLWPGLAELYPRAAEQPAPQEVRKRLLHVQALETVRCLDEGVLRHPADADLGAVLGWGFPAWTGGTISYIETKGLAAFVAEADRLAASYGERYAAPASLREMARKGQTYYGLATGGTARSAARGLKP